MNQLVDEDFIIIYPNPAKDYVVFEQNDNKRIQVIVYNMQGVVVDTFDIDTHIYKYPVNDYLSGIYTLVLMRDNDMTVKKLLIIK